MRPGLGTCGGRGKVEFWGFDPHSRPQPWTNSSREGDALLSVQHFSDPNLGVDMSLAKLTLRLYMASVM